MTKSNFNNRGFTLIELMVSIIVFSFFIGMMISSYLNLSTSLREANVNRKVYIEAREILDRLTQDIKQGTIDYSCYDGSHQGQNNCSSMDLSQGGSDILALIKENGTKKVFYKQNGGQLQIYKEQLLDAKTDSWANDSGFDPGIWKDIVGENIKVKKINFLIRPFQDLKVIAKDTAPDSIQEVYQPQVTILLSVEREHKSFDVQTTVVSRVY